ncbi:acyl carrier protein [Streptomyces tirandamycinicus]|uniref:Acyl carrier protein n=2 Tax=Streptomyces TaxID=1883 RepID=A0A2S1T0L9_9ACTN|nr:MULTISPECIES: acyl carrier protein [Streptomyces]ATJ00783.1 acyl carrier protein [Streptomyces sp. SCSIO 1666]AWI32202.1 acyl carrier protein [Streptomyces tirandamycinicus]MCY0979841.1 acyl carrier protein [Streptomyces tirandamycinicus]NNJ05095.1 acyl carrier protein [Streptomyces sp. PKU-MA01144]TFE36245.1 acyl carrier protein [Streptomyces sp. ICN441]
MVALTSERLFDILRECAGEEEAVTNKENAVDMKFTDLGYDSLALLETAARVSREYDVDIPEEDLSEVTTPAGFLTVVNTLLKVA